METDSQDNNLHKDSEIMDVSERMGELLVNEDEMDRSLVDNDDFSLSIDIERKLIEFFGGSENIDLYSRNKKSPRKLEKKFKKLQKEGMATPYVNQNKELVIPKTIDDELVLDHYPNVEWLFKDDELIKQFELDEVKHKKEIIISTVSKKEDQPDNIEQALKNLKEVNYNYLDRVLVGRGLYSLFDATGNVIDLISPIPKLGSAIIQIPKGLFVYAPFPLKERFRAIDQPEAEKYINNVRWMREIVRQISRNSDICDPVEKPNRGERRRGVIYRDGQVYVVLDKILNPKRGSWIGNRDIKKDMIELVPKYRFLAGFRNMFVPKTNRRVKAMNAAYFLDLLSDEEKQDALHIGVEYDERRDRIGIAAKSAARPLVVGGALTAVTWLWLHDVMADFIDENFPHLPQAVADYYELFKWQPAYRIGTITKEIEVVTYDLKDVEFKVKPELETSIDNVITMLKEIDGDYNNFMNRWEEYSELYFKTTTEAAYDIANVLDKGASAIAKLTGTEKVYTELKKGLGKHIDKMKIISARSYIVKLYSQDFYDNLLEKLDKPGATLDSILKDIGKEKKTHQEKTEKEQKTSMEKYLGWRESTYKTYRMQRAEANLASDYAGLLEKALKEYVKTRDKKAFDKVKEYTKSKDFKEKIEAIKKENSEEAKIVKDYFITVEDLYERVSKREGTIQELRDTYFKLGRLRNAYKRVGKTTPLRYQDKIDEMDKELEKIETLIKQQIGKAEKDPEYRKEIIEKQGREPAGYYKEHSVTSDFISTVACWIVTGGIALYTARTYAINGAKKLFGRK